MAEAGFVGKEVADPAQIEKELVRIWRDAAETDSKKEQSQGEVAPRVRSTLANVIFLSSGSEKGFDRKLLDPILDDLCVTFPSRFFLVHLADKGDGPKLRTGVSSRCVLANSGAHVCSEEVYITAGPEGAPLITNLLTGLLVADIEVVGVLFCDPATATREPFEQLLFSCRRTIEKFVYDSALFANYAESLESVLRFGEPVGDDGKSKSIQQAEGGLLADKRFEIKLRDVNWQRTKRWRVLVAEQFSNTRSERGSHAITSVRLVAGGAGDTILGKRIAADVLIMAGWFAGVLGWEPRAVMKVDSRDGFQIVCVDSAAKGHSIEIVGKGNVNNSSAALLQSIEMNIDENGVERQLSLAKVSGDQLVEIAFQQRNVPVAPDSVRRSPFVNEPVEKLLHTSIISGYSDRDFSSALSNSLRIAQMIDAV